MEFSLFFFDVKQPLQSLGSAPQQGEPFLLQFWFLGRMHVVFRAAVSSGTRTRIGEVWAAEPVFVPPFPLL